MMPTGMLLLPTITNAKSVQMFREWGGIRISEYRCNFMNIFNSQMAKSKDADRQDDYTLYKQVGNGGHRVATCYVNPWETEAAVLMQTHHNQSRPPEHEVGEERKWPVFIFQTSSHPDYSSTKKEPESHV